MKSRILTDKEKEIISTYLKSKTKLEGFRMLLSRCRKNVGVFEEDIELIHTFLKKT